MTHKKAPKKPEPSPDRSRSHLIWLAAFIIFGIVSAYTVLAEPRVIAQLNIVPAEQLKNPLSIKTETPTFTVTTITPPQTETSMTETFQIGQSVLGSPLQVTRIGRGRTTLVLIAALHGTESNAANLLNDLVTHYLTNLLPDHLSLFVLPVANPDGALISSRFNANNVDLNRNWETIDWQSDTFGPMGTVVGGGGTSPFSEPESSAISSWLLEMADSSSTPITVIFYHSAFPPSGLVLPSYTWIDQLQISNETATEYGLEYAAIIKSEFSNIWDDYHITGEAVQWCGDNQIICLDIELPTLEDLAPSEILAHISALDNLINNFLGN